MKKLGFWLVAVLLAAGLCSAGPRGNSPTKDEVEIRALEDRFAAAFKAKDIEAIMKAYAPGVGLFVFDVCHRASTSALTPTKRIGKNSSLPFRVPSTNLSSPTSALPLTESSAIATAFNMWSRLAKMVQRRTSRCV